SGSSWSEQAKLISSDGAALDNFSEGLALSGDTAIIGAPFKQMGGKKQQGEVYVWNRTGTMWSEADRLVSSDAAAGDLFGAVVALVDDTFVVSAVGKQVLASAQQGQAYIFTRSGDTFSESQKLVSSDGASGDFFGQSVAFDQDSVVLGANY